MTNGLTIWTAQGGSTNALVTATPVQVTTGPTALQSFKFINTGALATYVQWFDALVAGVTLGTTPPKWADWIPAGGAWEDVFPAEDRVFFTTGIVIAATTTPTGSTAPATGINATVGTL